MAGSGSAWRVSAWRFRWQAIAWLALALAGCGSVPQPEQAKPEPLKTSPPPAPPPPVSTSRPELPVLPPAGSGRGGYYQDDGPGDAPPAGLLEVPDAIPKVEPYATRGNKPYVVFGHRYVPITDDRPYKERGRGSWYGKKFQGQRTSSGEPYDMYKMTAAHPTLPIPSYARVTNLANGRQVIVRINDRGPFHPGRIIDLSYTAALKLGYLQSGSSELEVERLLPADIERMAAARSAAQQEQASQQAPADAVSAPVAPLAAAAAATAEPSPDSAASGDSSTAPSTPVAVVSAAAPTTAGAPASGFYLQFGTYSQRANAEAIRARLQAKGGTEAPPVEVAGYGLFYRVFSGPFPTRAEARAAALRLQGGGAPKPLVVQR